MTTVKHFLKRHVWKVGLAVALLGGLGALFAWGFVASKDESAFVVAYVGLLANIVMAIAAAWAFRAWHLQIRGQALHVLASDAMTWARRVEREWHRAIDLWKMLSTVDTNQFAPLDGHLAALTSRTRELPELIARMEGLCGKDAAGPLHALGLRIDDLTTAIIIDKEKRTRHSYTGSDYEPQASVTKARSGFLDLEGAKGRVTETVELLGGWAAKHLGTERWPGVDRNKLDDIIDRDKASSAAALKALGAETKTNPGLRVEVEARTRADRQDAPTQQPDPHQATSSDRAPEQ